MTEYAKTKRREALARRGIRLADKWLNILVIALCVLFLGLTIYASYDSTKLAVDNSSNQWTPYRPSLNEEAASESFEELQAMNPDVIGWLTLYDTDIDFPLLHSNRNDTYLSKNPKGEYSLMGSIFLNAKSAPDFSDLTTVVYGHHVRQDEVTGKDQMFGGLDRFADYDYFISHQYGDIYAGGHHYGTEAVAFIEGADAYDREVFKAGITDPEEQAAFLDYLTTLYKYQRPGSEILPTDHIALLSTCASTGANDRTILVVKLYDEPFAHIVIQPDERVYAGTGLNINLNEIEIPFIPLIVAYLGLIALYAVSKALGPVDIGRREKKRAKRAEE